MLTKKRLLVLAVVAILLVAGLLARVHFGAGPATQAVCGGPFTSVEQLPDNRVTFRICAPKADYVKLVDDAGGNPEMTRDSSGLYSGTTEKPIDPGFYRYYFIVEDVRTVDPHATYFSENRDGVMGVYQVKGSGADFMDFHENVPHGAVAELRYWSRSLNAKRRLHIYMPPGYETDNTRYPVLYLLHGAGDSDNSWSTIGRANAIMDNLIAAGRARKMIVVMPFGHVPGREPSPGKQAPRAIEDFSRDLLEDVIPLVDSRYRTLNDADHRAIAGLSMGGGQTLRIGLTHPEVFHYAGLFSMSIRDSGTVEAQYGTDLDRAASQMKLVYYALGKQDPVFPSPQPVVDLLARHRIPVILNHTDGGHNWRLWQDYLYDYAPRLFQ
jgi:enterochelin esterase family protein